MSIAALITIGIGVGSTPLFLMTGGLGAEVAAAATQPTGGKWSQDPYRRFKAPEEQDAEPAPVEIMSGVVDRGRHVVIIPGRPMAFDTDESMRLLRRVRRSRANAEREAEDDDAMLLLF